MTGDQNNGSALEHYLSMVRPFLLLSKREEMLLSDTITALAANLYLKQALNFWPTPRQISLSVSKRYDIKPKRVEKIFHFFNQVDFREDVKTEDLIGNRLSLIFMFAKLGLCSSNHVQLFSEYYCFDASGPDTRSLEQLKKKHGCTDRVILHRVMRVWRVLCPPKPEIPKEHLRSLLPRDLIVTGLGGKFVEHTKFIPSFNVDPIGQTTTVRVEKKIFKEQTETLEPYQPIKPQPNWERIYAMPRPAGVTPTALPIGETIGKLVVIYIDVLVEHLNGSIKLVDRHDVLQLSHQIFENGLDQPSDGASPKTGITPIPELARQQLVRLVDDITSEINGGANLVPREAVIDLIKDALSEVAPRQTKTKKHASQKKVATKATGAETIKATPIELSTAEAKYLDGVAATLKKKCGAPKRKGTVLLLAAELFPTLNDGDGTTKGLLRLAENLDGKAKPTAFPANEKYHQTIGAIITTLAKHDVAVTKPQAARLLTMWLKHTIGDPAIISHYQDLHK